MSEQTALQVIPGELFRVATDVAHVCREIVTKTAVDIQGRKYVKVEGWMSIATAHGCVASAGEVVQMEKGVSAIGEIRRMSDGVVLCQAEGFVGADETTWYGGPAMVWDKIKKCKVEKILEKRPDYAIRAMAQTRAVSRACRTAFAHVVVLMDAGLQTTPAEEVPHGGFGDEPATVSEPESLFKKPGVADKVVEAAKNVEVPRDSRGAFMLPAGVKWGDVAVHFGKNKGKLLRDLEDNTISWYAEKWEPRPMGQQADISAQDKLLLAAVNAWADEKDARSGKTGGRD